MKLRKAAVLVLAVLLVALTLTSCGNPAKKIIGTWVNSKSTIITGVNTETKYTFNEDGTGSCTVTLAQISFTYEFNDNGQLVLKENIPLVGEKTVVFTCEFEKDTLRLTDTDGESLVYTKQA